VMLIVGDKQAIEPPLRKLGFEVVAAPPELSE
jgi:hypothetical protein